MSNFWLACFLFFSGLSVFLMYRRHSRQDNEKEDFETRISKLEDIINKDRK